MIDLLNEITFWEFVAENNTYIQHQPGTTGPTNRFSRFNDEGTIGELSDLGWPRLELRDAPFGVLHDNNGGYQYDEMTRAVRIISKVEGNNFTDKATVQNNCKMALLQIVAYIKAVKQNGTCCDNGSDILCAFDMNSVQYEVLEYATADGSFAGVQMRLRLKADFNPEEVTYGPWPDYPVTLCAKIKQCLGIATDGDAQLYLNQQGEWVAPGGDVDLTDYYTKEEADAAFAAISHSHAISDITGLQTALNSKAATVHAHAISDVTGLQTALNNKAAASDLSDHTGNTANPHAVTLEQARAQANGINGNINANGNTVKNLAAAVDSADPIRKAEFDALASTVVKRRGGIDLSTNPNFPASQAGDRWEVTVAGKIGGAGGRDLQVWDEIVCTADTAGGDWATANAAFYFVQADVGGATESTAGTILLASTAETETGTNDSKAITALKLANWFTYVKTLAQTFAAKITFTSAPRFSSVNANQYLKSDGSKDLTGVDNIPATDVATDSTHRFATDTEKTTWNAKEDASNKDTDGTLAANSDTKYASQKATKTYVDTAAATKADKYYSPDSHSGATYTLAAGDVNKLQCMSHSSGITVTVPNDTNAPGILVGYVFRLSQESAAGQITLSPDTGVTINNRSGLKSIAQYAIIALEKKAANTWVAYGELTT